MVEGKWGSQSEKDLQPDSPAAQANNKPLPGLQIARLQQASPLKAPVQEPAPAHSPAAGHREGPEAAPEDVAPEHPQALPPLPGAATGLEGRKAQALGPGAAVLLTGVTAAAGKGADKVEHEPKVRPPLENAVLERVNGIFKDEFAL